jgi:nitrate/nitrite transporter NarK
VKSFHDVLAMRVLLGIAGASFGVALSLGSGWFPKQYKGLAMGIAGAGNSGTALAALFAPRLAMHFGWQAVYGFAAATMVLPFAVMIFFAKEPPDIEHQSLRGHLSCLFEISRRGHLPAIVLLLPVSCFEGAGRQPHRTCHFDRLTLVPLRWPLTTAVAGGMIGEIGALGGGILPNLLGQSKQHIGSYRSGFLFYAILAVAVLVVMRIVSRSWTKTWVAPGGRAIDSTPIYHTVTTLRVHSCGWCHG